MPNLPKTLQTLIIEHVEPELDGGRYPIKRIVGEKLDVTADIFKEGHDTIGAVLRYKTLGHKEWLETPMHHVDNDRWAGSFPLSENTRYLYSVGAYVRSFETWRIELTKKQGWFRTFPANSWRERCTSKRPWPERKAPINPS